MEANEMSFSLPTWKQQQIKSLTEIQQQVLYASSPYSLNDFKSYDNPEPLFGTPLSSQLPHYHMRKPYNPRLPPQLAFFSVFLHQLVFLHTEKGADSKCPIQSLKEHIQTTDLCSLRGTPEQWRPYYTNQIIKKVLLQYLNKCLCNSSLIDIIPSTNAFLRFSVTLLLKGHLLAHGLIQNFDEELSLSDKIVSYSRFFESLCKSSPQLSEMRFNQRSGQFKTFKYLLIEESQTLYMYVYVPCSSQKIEQEEQKEEKIEQKPKQQEVVKPRPELKKKQTSQHSLKLRTNQKKSSEGSSDKSLWGCLSYLCS